MSRFKFHIYNGDMSIDDQGIECSDLQAARAHAIAGARSIMADEIKVKGEISLGHRIEIEDERAEIHILTFADAVRINS